MNRATSLILNPSESKVEASERPAEVEVVEIPLDVTAGELEVDLAESIADARIGLPGRLHLVQQKPQLRWGVGNDSGHFGDTFVFVHSLHTRHLL